MGHLSKKGEFMSAQRQNRADAPQGAAALAAELEQTLKSAELYISVSADNRELTLTGEVDSGDNHRAALDLAQPIAERLGLRIADNIIVMEMVPDDTWEMRGESEQAFGADHIPDPETRAEAEELSLDPDFTGDVGTTDSEVAAAEAIPYFPPTDPVVEPSSSVEQLSVVGGFQATSMDPEDDEGQGAAPPADQFDDDELAENILRELRQDAMTTELLVRVKVNRGVATLTGEAPSLEDAEQAEAVAARVPGVQEVREELRVIGLEGDHRFG
jgi:osmotically-inducible protein OsmY